MNLKPTPPGDTASRRRFLTGAASSVALATAGCVGGASQSDERGDTDRDDAPVVVASFFTFYDFTRRIAAGTPVRVHNLVPVGLHGHGWEPDPSITRDIIDADAFVHVGEGFQPWADRAIQTVRDDDAGTHLIDAREGIDLLALADTLEEDEEVGDGKDPHFWLDPIRAKSAVENLVIGLAETFPGHEADFVENAETLNEELEALDGRWQRVFDDAKREVVFLAAHNAFEYVGDRYGAKIQPLVTNLAATDDVRPADMRRAQETIADNDIRYIGAAIFEPRRPAKQLLEGTAVEAYYPVTPYAGTRREWVDRGWGYLEIARNINVPTFEIVLGTAAPEETSLGEEWRNFE
ncbi:MAG: metal ABC transporter substrate-binding protein [Haloferacaceae archaeon]